MSCELLRRFLGEVRIDVIGHRLAAENEPIALTANKTVDDGRASADVGNHLTQSCPQLRAVVRRAEPQTRTPDPCSAEAIGPVPDL